MKRTLGQLALAGVFAAMASSASAITITPFDTGLDGLNAGESTLGNAVASTFEDYNGTELGFTVEDNLAADISITVNPYLLSPSGIPSNSIALSYVINGATPIDILVNQVNVPSFGAIGAAGLALSLQASDVVSFFIDGVAGGSGNQVTFIVETTAAVPIGASGLLLLSGFGLLAATRRRKVATEI